MSFVRMVREIMDELIIQNQNGDNKFVFRDGKEYAIVDGKEIPLADFYKAKRDTLIKRTGE